MAENDKTSEPAVVPPGTEGAPPVPPKRSPGHRGADVKDTVAEMAAKAHEISLEAGSKMSAAMKDVVNAAAGLSGFVMESARDLVQFMVRRGQMTQEEADKLIRQVEEHQPKRKPTATKSSRPRSAAGRPPARVRRLAPSGLPARPASTSADRGTDPPTGAAIPPRALRSPAVRRGRAPGCATAARS